MMLLTDALTIHQLRLYANKWLKNTYNMELTIPLNLNGRLIKTCGRFVYTKYSNGSPSTPKKIDMNKFFVENNEASIVIDVLKHELIHYVLFMKGLPHADGQPTFEKELKRLGVISQSTIDKYKIIRKPTNISVYKCINPNCNKEYNTKRALHGDGAFHKCGKCRSALMSLGKRMVSA